MADPYVGEIRLMAFARNLEKWALCNGQLLRINQNQVLFSLIGTTYGGDGVTTFALPDLRGRVPMHAGPNYKLGQHGGEAAHSLNVGELPAHTHALGVTTATGDKPTLTHNVFASAMTYGSPDTNHVFLADATVSSSGSGKAHENMQPSLVLNFYIALVGLFPPRD
jgi:microcystin-dependent protein